MRHSPITRHALRFRAVMAVNIALIAVFGFGAAGASTMSLNSDRNGLDIVSFQTTTGSPGIDTTTLVLDRNGADIPEGNWWGDPNMAANLSLSAEPVRRGPDITKLNLDRDGADIVPD